MNTANLILIVFNLLTFIFLLRFFMQLFQTSFFNPISQTIIKITTPVVKPLNMLLPNTTRFNSASLILAFLMQIIAIVIIQYLYNGSFIINAQVVILALIKFITLLFDFFFYAAIIYALLSWVVRDPSNPLNNLLGDIMHPILKPIRAIVPAIGGLDLSVMIFIFGLSLIRGAILPELLAAFGL